MSDFDFSAAPLSLDATLSAPDVSPAGTLPSAENLHDVTRYSRREWLGLSVAACGAALALAAAPAHAIAHPDTQALRFLEELELLQQDFWTRAAASSAAYGMEGRERDVIHLIAKQDREHSEWFRLARQKFGVSEFGHFYTPNASQSRPPRLFSFSQDAFKTRRELFPMGQMLKDTSVAAYHGIVARTSNGEMTEAIAALAGIEGRHAAALREISGVSPLPEAFEPALDAQTVARRLARYGFSGEAIQ